MNRSTSRRYIFGGEQPNFLLLRIHGATIAFVILSRELSEPGGSDGKMPEPKLRGVLGL